MTTFEEWWKDFSTNRGGEWLPVNEIARTAWKAATVAAMSDIERIIDAAIERVFNKPYPVGFIDYPKIPEEFPEGAPRREPVFRNCPSGAQQS